MTGLVETHGMRHTAKALAEYDTTEADREKLFNAIDDMASFNVWENADCVAQEAVRKAFFEDTRDRNTQDCIKHVSFAFIRQMVASHPPK